ncbi:hypothetical protein LOK49_LG10G03016 [Camellia lanceoleosa]|uniref:Uncharacterized protein n=1 Tax=Camellia lanceoleosa TaxID=1840588 RepID=A0ACC0GHL8_9ERIC|nr:hypothetical protein LOK49_LG10G03016 [Camellia lanceoleosa]
MRVIGKLRLLKLKLNLLLLVVVLLFVVVVFGEESAVDIEDKSTVHTLVGEASITIAATSMAKVGSTDFFRKEKHVERVNGMVIQLEWNFRAGILMDAYFFRAEIAMIKVGFRDWLFADAAIVFTVLAFIIQLQFMHV